MEQFKPISIDILCNTPHYLFWDLVIKHWILNASWMVYSKLLSLDKITLS